jgi:hypothetical protein
MPSKQTRQRALRAKRRGKAPSSQAGEFVREEIHHVREGKHGARSAKQAIAIGLSKARRAGIDLRPPAPGQASAQTRRRAERDYAKGRAAGSQHASQRRSRATRRALAREAHAAASHQALARQSRRSTKRRSARSRSAAAKKAARTRARRR